ncbi:MAG: response regulator, partial [Clostridium sp.]
MIKVMIIEDDPMVRDINSRFLKRIDGFKLYKAV